jgi:hypothetical protein
MGTEVKTSVSPHWTAPNDEVRSNASEGSPSSFGSSQIPTPAGTPFGGAFGGNHGVPKAVEMHEIVSVPPIASKQWSQSSVAGPAGSQSTAPTAVSELPSS